MDNRYYRWWKENKLFLALFPAFVFWVVSMIFFVVGLKFNTPVVFFGADLSITIAIALSLSNTVIQIIGNEQDPEEIGLSLWIMWIGSYLLGIGTNVATLLTLLGVDNIYLEWFIAIGLGTVIEVAPERLLVMFLKGFRGFRRFRPNVSQGTNFRPINQGNQQKPGQQFKFPPKRVEEEEEEEKPFFFHGLNNQQPQKSNKPGGNFRR